jgi:hypothetical protein
METIEFALLDQTRHQIRKLQRARALWGFSDEDQELYAVLCGREAALLGRVSPTLGEGTTVL